MDAKLTKVACQHLQLFVEICDRTIELRHSKRKKLRVFSKLLFLDENGIDDLLQKMASLVDQEGRLVTAQMFNFVSEAVTNTQQNLIISREMDDKIDVLMEERFDQRKEHEIKKRRDIILKTLTFDENKLDSVKRSPIHIGIGITTITARQSYLPPASGSSTTLNTPRGKVIAKAGPQSWPSKVSRALVKAT